MPMVCVPDFEGPSKGTEEGSDSEEIFVSVWVDIPNKLPDTYWPWSYHWYSDFTSAEES